MPSEGDRMDLLAHCPECSGTGYHELEGADGMLAQDGCGACYGTGYDVVPASQLRGAVEERDVLRNLLREVRDDPHANITLALDRRIKAMLDHPGGQ